MRIELIQKIFVLILLPSMLIGTAAMTEAIDHSRLGIAELISELSAISDSSLFPSVIPANSNSIPSLQTKESK